MFSAHESIESKCVSERQKGLRPILRGPQFHKQSRFGCTLLFHCTQQQVLPGQTPEGRHLHVFPTTSFQTASGEL